MFLLNSRMYLSNKVVGIKHHKNILSIIKCTDDNFSPFQHET